MFTGIIEEVGRIRAIERQAVSARLTVAASKVLSDVHLGDSIAVNGVCLTVTSFGRDYFCADVMHETLNRSSLGALGVKSPVNLERADGLADISSPVTSTEPEPSGMCAGTEMPSGIRFRPQNRFCG